MSKLMKGKLVDEYFKFIYDEADHALTLLEDETYDDLQMARKGIRRIRKYAKQGMDKVMNHIVEQTSQKQARRHRGLNG